MIKFKFLIIKKSKIKEIKVFFTSKSYKKVVLRKIVEQKIIKNIQFYKSKIQLYRRKSQNLKIFRKILKLLFLKNNNPRKLKQKAKQTKFNKTPKLTIIKTNSKIPKLSHSNYSLINK